MSLRRIDSNQIDNSCTSMPLNGWTMISIFPFILSCYHPIIWFILLFKRIVIVDFNGLMDLDLQIILCTVRVVFESMNTLKFALLLTSGSVLAQWSHVMNTQLSVVSWTLKEVCIPLVQYRLVVEMLTTK